MFKSITPERAGISSKKVLDYLKALDEYRLGTHAFLLARGDEIFSETYYAPYDKDCKHRMYSVSKSITAIAVGFAIDDGLFSLDDRVIDYFPEYDNDGIDEFRRQTTIRDLLTMRSSVTNYIEDWWGKPDRLASSFTTLRFLMPR